MARIPSIIATATVAVGAALVAGAGPVPAGAATPAKKAPVTLSGKVENKGVTKAKRGKVSLEADSFFFAKTFVKAKPGTVMVTVENASSVPHTFTVDDQVDEELAPGDETTVSVDVTADEPVVFYCRFHRGSGMQGALFTPASKGKSTETTSSTGRGAYDY